MEAKAVKPAVDVNEAVKDLVELLAKATLSGIGIAVAMAVTILVLSGGSLPA